MLVPSRRRGVGEYPGYYCYDAGRPSWLPYWLDDLTESACKWSPKTIVGNVYACAAGSPECGKPSAAMQNPDLSGPGVAAPGEPSNVPTCLGFMSFNPDTAQCEFDPSRPSFLILLAGLFGMVLLFGRRR